MSYDYLIFRAGKNVPAEMSAIEENDLIPVGTYSDLKAKILTLYPQTKWNDTERRGGLIDDIGRFEFNFYEESQIMRSFSIRTSHRQDRNATQQFIEKLCNRLGVFALDGQQLNVFGCLNPETQKVASGSIK